MIYLYCIEKIICLDIEGILLQNGFNYKPVKAKEIQDHKILPGSILITQYEEWEHTSIEEKLLKYFAGYPVIIITTDITGESLSTDPNKNIYYILSEPFKDEELLTLIKKLHKE